MLMQEATLLQRIITTVYTPSFKDIVECTYAYKKIWSDTYFNITVFSHFAWCSFLDSPDTLYARTQEMLNTLQEQIQFFLQQICLLPHPTYKARIMESSLRYALLCCDFVSTWLWFEIQKIWYDIPLSEKDSMYQLIRLQHIEQELFWPLVSSVSTEITWCYHTLQTIYAQGNWKLSSCQKKNFVSVLHKISSLPAFDVHAIASTSKTFSKDIRLDPNIFQFPIARKDYICLFENVLSLYGLDVAVVQEERSSIYDRSDALCIPIHPSYDTLSLFRILQLIAHEIETHYIIKHNNRLILGDFAWWWHIAREEWLALYNELSLDTFVYDPYFVSISVVKTLLGEICLGDEYIDMLQCLSFMQSKHEDVYPAFLRKKRNYSFAFSGVQHKDCMYTRWFHAIHSYIQQGKSIDALYMANVAFDDIASLPTDVTYILPKYIAKSLFLFLQKEKKMQYTSASLVQKCLLFLTSEFST